MKSWVRECGRPVGTEGGIWTPEQLRAALDTGVLAAVGGDRHGTRQERDNQAVCSRN